MKAYLGILARQARDRAGILLILFLFALWYGSNQGGALWADEMVYTGAASSMLSGDFQVNTEHPPLAKYIMSCGEWLAGSPAAGARAVTTVFSLLSLLLLHETVRLLTPRKPLALLAPVILGTCSQFSALAVQAMLDMYLLFFALVLFHLGTRYLLRAKEGGPAGWLPVLLGVAASCTFLSKYYGFLFVITTVPILVFRTGSSGRFAGIGQNPEAARTVLRFLIGFGAATLVIMLPYLRPEVIGGSLFGNLSHLEKGHRIMVGASYYQYPPAWSYLYWMPEEWGLPLVVASVLSIAGLAVSKGRGYGGVALYCVAYLLLPLAALSLMSVKFPRYMLPLLPAAILIAVLFVSRAWDGLERPGASKPAGNGQRPAPSRRPERDRARTRALAALLVLVPLVAQLVGVALDPAINTDSGYDVAARKITDLYDSSDRSSLVVLSWWEGLLRYYLPGNMGGRNITLRDLDFTSDETLSALEGGGVDLVLDYGGQPRFTDTAVYKLIRTTHVERLTVEGDLFLFRMR